jgi:iron complex outermembrane receptor protein
MAYKETRTGCGYTGAKGGISILALAFGLAAFAGPQAAFAQALASDSQSSPPQAPAASTAEAPPVSGGVDEIVVTAQRRSENLQRTPLAITALSASALTQRNIQTTQDLMQTTPSLQVSTLTGGAGPGSATFFLRGMGQQRSTNGSEPAVGVYIDDFYYPSLQGAVFSLLDLNQVEVLRGPQGTLFGRNTIGGAIRYTSKKPELGQNSGFVQGTLGSYNRQDVSGAFNLGISDAAAVRVSGGRLRTDGYVDQQDGGKAAGATRTDLVRGQLRLAPTRKIDVNLSAEYSRSYTDGFPYTQPGPIAPPAGSLPYIWNSLPAGTANPYDNRYVSRCTYCQAGTGQREFSDTRFADMNGTINWNLTDKLSIKSLTGWQRIRTSSLIDLDGTPLPIFDDGRDIRTTALSQEIQINNQAFDDRLNWVAGAYYYKQTDTPLNLTHTTLGRSTATTYDHRHLETKAAFVDANFALNDVFKILGGVRYSDDSKDALLRSAAGAELASASRSFKSVTWRAGLQAQLTPTAMAYASVSTGFRGGGFNVPQNAAVTTYSRFDPEKVTSFEGGARLELFDRKLRLNPTVFYTKWRDIQVQSVIVDPVIGVFASLDNAGKAHSYGAELESELAVTSHLRLFGNMAYLHLRYDDVGNAIGITVNSKFQRAPKLTYSLGASYQTRFANDVGLKLSTNWSWQDVQYSTPTDSDQLRLPSYGLLNARAEVTSPGDRIGFAVFMTNITNKTYYVGGVNYTANAGTYHYDLGRPREVGLTVRYNF